MHRGNEPVRMPASPVERTTNGHMEHTRHLRGMDKQPDSVQPDNNQVCDVGAAVRQLIGHVTLESIGLVQVSTVDLSTNPHMPAGFGGYETCLFWGPEIEPGYQRESDVVQTYPTWQAAEQGHQYWLRPENVARAIHQYGGWSTIGSIIQG